MLDLGALLGARANIGRVIAIARVIRLIQRYRVEPQRPAAGRLGALCQREEPHPVESQTSPTASAAPAQAEIRDPASELRRACASLVTTTERLSHDVHALAGTLLALAPLLQADLQPEMLRQPAPAPSTEPERPADLRATAPPEPPGTQPETPPVASLTQPVAVTPPVRFIPRPVRLNRRGAQPASSGPGYRVLAW
jgi:hypothetical protein